MRYWLSLLLILSLAACGNDKPKTVTPQERKERQEKKAADLPENMPIEQRSLKALRDSKQFRKDIEQQNRENKELLEGE
jgi:hypothetical protein